MLSNKAQKITGEEQYKMLVENGLALLCIHDLAGNIKQVNKAALHELGYTLEEMVDNNLKQFIPPSHAKDFDNYLERIKHHKTDVGILPILTKEGDLRYWSYKNTLKDEQIIGFSQDVTDRILTHQELIAAKEIAEEAARIKQEFLVNMSHEIRTPMNAIMGFARLLLQAGLDEENRQYAQTIYESADTLLVVINDILDFSKLDDGKMPIVPIHFDLQKSLNSLQKFFSVKLDEGYVKLIFDTDKKLPPALIGDPVRITQVLSNLINNAIKFTENGFVEVKTSIISHQKDEYAIQFSVKDTGIGISQDNIKSIFNSFEQAEGDITRRFGGTGLGLTIVKKLLDLMGGQIHVDSQEGIGSIFTVSIPLKEGEVNQIIKEEIREFKNLPLELLNGKLILLVEDNRNNQVLATKILSDVGCQVDIAENGRVAIQKIMQKRYEIVLMDIQMPVLDGLEATKVIRSLDPPCNTIPIIAMTAHALKEEESKYKKAGMNDYISKPYTPDILYSKLLHAFGYYQGETNNTSRKTSPQSSPYQPDQINFDSLKQYAGDDKDFYLNMLTIFSQDVPGYLGTMEDALQHKNWDALKKTVHTLKSSLSIIGMENTLIQINEIETNNLNEMEFAETSAKCNFIKENCEKALELAREELEGDTSSA